MTIGGRHLAGAHHLVEAQAQAVALAVAQPADAGGQALEGDPLAGQGDPAVEGLVVGELLEHGPVGGGDVGGVAGQGHPAERPLALAEQRADVGGQEAGVVEGPVEAAELGLGAQAVAVVEDLGAPVEEADHGLAVGGHRLPGPAGQLARVGAGHLGGGLGGQVGGDVAERVVGAGLVGDDVGGEVEVEQLGQDHGGVADQADREAPGARPGPGCSGRRRPPGSRPPRRGSGSRAGARCGRGRPRRRGPRRRSW